MLFNKTRQILKTVSVTTASRSVSRGGRKGWRNTRGISLVGLVLSAILMMILVSPVPVYANGHVAGHGFERISEGRLSSGFQLRVPLGGLAAGTDNLDSITASYQPASYQPLGFDVSRISVSWNNEAGKLTVGNDWASFQDILGVNKGFESANISNKNRTVASQIKWLSADGFSISLESTPKTTSYSATNTTGNTTSPSLILSWQGGAGGVAGEYRVSAMGRKFDANAKGQKFDGRDLAGWGLNMEGGWQIDDLFATLAITVGKGIDSYILQKYGDNLVVTPNYDNSGTSLSIRPSLYYSLNNNSNFHVSLGHHTSNQSFNNYSLDTLDTISMGYNWSPWPSAKLDIELVGQKASSQDGVDGSTQVKINAEKRF